MLGESPSSTTWGKPVSVNEVNLQTSIEINTRTSVEVNSCATLNVINGSLSLGSQIDLNTSHV